MNTHQFNESDPRVGFWKSAAESFNMNSKHEAFSEKEAYFIYVRQGLKTSTGLIPWLELTLHKRQREYTQQQKHQ